MPDIAQLGFDIDTKPLQSTNAELVALVGNAGNAQKAVSSLAMSLSKVGRTAAANLNAVSVAMAAVGSAGGNATQAATRLATANTTSANAARASAAAMHGAATATNAAAAAQQAAAASANSYAAAVQRMAANANAARVSQEGHTQSMRAGAGAATDLGAGMGRIIAMGAAFIAALKGGNAIVKAIEDWVNLKNAMKLANIEGDDAAEVQKRIFDMAQKSGVPVDAMTTLYRRGSIAVKELGGSQNDLLKVMGGVAAALRIQGTSVESARGALLQLSQAFGTGVVRAEEFNSLQENAYPLLLAAAKGMAGMDGSVVKLTNAVKAGKVTSKEFFDAIKAGTPEIEAMANGMQMTLGQSLAVATNGFIEFIGKLDDATGFSTTIGNALQWVGTKLRELGDNRVFVEGVRAAFAQLVKVVEATVREVATLWGWLQSIWSMGQQFAREQNTKQATEGLAALDQAIKDTNEDIGNLKYNIGNLPKDFTGDGDAMAKYMRFTTQLEKDNQKLAGLLKDRVKIEQNALRMTLGTPSVGDQPPPVTGREFGAPSKLDNTVPATPIDMKNKGGQAAANKWREVVGAMNEVIAKNVETARSIDMVNQKYNAQFIFEDRVADFKKAGIALTDQQIAKLKELAQAQADSAYAAGTLAFLRDMTRATEDFVAQQNLELRSLELSGEQLKFYTYQQQLLNKAKKEGLNQKGELTDDINAQAAAMAKAAQETENYKDALALVKDVGKSALSSFINDLRQGVSLWDALGNAANKALDKIIDKLADVAIDSMFGGSKLEDLFNGLGGLFGGKGATKTGTGTGLSASGNLSGGIFDALGGMWSTTKDWFGGMFGGGGGLSPAASAMPHGATSIGGGLFGTGISAGGALGAIGGLASGAMGLFGGGKKSTASTIGSIGQMVGGVVSLIPGIGQIAGPIISILSSVLPSLLGGDTPPKITNQEYGQLSYGANGFTTSGGAWGPDANANNLQGPLGQMGKSMQAIFDALGGVKDAAKVWGVAMESFSQSQGNWSFSNKTSFLVGPNGQKRQWGMGSTEGDIGMETAGVKATVESILGGAVGEISKNMRKALEGLLTTGKEGFEVLSTAVGEILTFDKTLKELGQTVTAAGEALKQIDDSFQGMYDTAKKYGLDIGQVDAAKNTAKAKVGADFAQTIDRALMDPLTLALTEIGDERTDLLRNNSALIGVQGYVDQAAKIEQIYLKKRNEIMEEYNAAAVAAAKQAAEDLKRLLGGIDDYVKMLLPGGSLSGVGATAQLAGLQSNYNNALSAAQKKPNDEQTINDFMQAGEALAQFAKDYYGSNDKYIALRNQLVADAQSQQTLANGGKPVVSGTTAANDVSTQTQFIELLSTVDRLTKQLEESQKMNQQLMAKLELYVSNPR